MGSTAESSRAWAEVVAHDARFEFPDVIGFAEGGPDGSAWRAGPWAAAGRLHRPVALAKRCGGDRVLSILDPVVHARYRALVARVAGSIERSLGPEVTAARTPGAASGRRVAPGRGLALQAWRRAWRRHLLATSRMGAGEGPLIRLDVRDCFGSIRAEVVAESLGRCGVPSAESAELVELLGRFEADGVRGLPVGPEPSAVLANLALARADEALRTLGLPFVRWCDDVVVALRREDPAVAVEAWADALSPLGLEPAPEKCVVVAARDMPHSSMALSLEAAATPLGNRVAVHVGARASSLLVDRAVEAAEGPDPHLGRSLVALIGPSGGRRARTALRHLRRRAPHLASTVEWGLRC
jgi:hypothetical protein